MAPDPDGAPSRRALIYIHRLALANPTGVHRYVVELAQALSREASRFGIELCSGRVRGERASLAGVRLSHPRAPRRPLHLSWTATTHPSIERVVGKIDLLHVSAPVFPIRSQAPAIITIHDLLPMQRPEWYGRWPREAFRRCIEFHAETAAAIIAPSQYTADTLSRELGIDAARVRVIHEGVDDRFAEPTPAGEIERLKARLDLHSPFFVAIGEVGARKNLPVLFEAFSRLGKRDDSAPHLVVVGGDGIGAGEIKAAAERAGANRRIHFVGRLPDSELRALLQHARALLHPSLLEGFGLTPLEAMAAGTPAVVSDAGSLPEVTGGAAIVLPAQDPEPWAETITSLLDDSDLRETLIERGRAHARQLTWHAAAVRTLRVYEEVSGT